MPAFICGLDLGQVNDPTALIIVERVAPEEPAGKPTYDVRHIERLLGMSYPDIVEHVVERFQQVQPGNDVKLIIDGTGVGRPVVDMLWGRLGSFAHPVTITGGDAVTKGEDGYFRVPKRDLAGAVQVLLQSKRLRFPSRSRDVKALTDELKNFKVKIDPKTAHDSYSAWRETDHDDLVLALALAVWAGENPVHFQVKGPVTRPFIVGVRVPKRTDQRDFFGRDRY